MAIRLTDPSFLLHKVGGHDIIFEISDEKEKAGDATITYYGYLAYNGSWIIQENDTDEGTYRYVAGTSDYATYWAARESQTYVLFSALTIGES